MSKKIQKLKDKTEERKRHYESLSQAVDINKPKNVNDFISLETRGEIGSKL